MPTNHQLEARRDTERRERAMPEHHKPIGDETVAVMHGPPDSMGRRQYTLLWRGWNPNTDSVTIRGQVYFSNSFPRPCRVVEE